MTRQAFAAFAGSSAFAAFAGFDDFSVFVAMTWVHIDLVLLVDLVRLVRNVAVWFPHPYATIHLEIILRLNYDTLELTSETRLHGRNHDDLHFSDDEPEIV